MTEERDRGASTDDPANESSDLLAEIEAEIAEDLAEETAPPGGPMYQWISAALTLTLGITGAVLAYGYGLGSLSEPGPGLWPFMLAVTIAVLSAALLVVGRSLQDSEAFTWSSLQVLAGVVTFVVLAFLMPIIGFEIPAFALSVVWLRFLGGESWRSTVLIGLATTAAFYFLFLYALGIALPHLF